MKNKRAQITAYIILALVTIAIIGFIYYIMFYTKSLPSSDQLISPSDTAAIRNYVQSCIDEVSVLGVYLLADKGGYIYSYNEILNTEDKQIAYHLNLGNEVYPRKQFMEQELASFIENSIILCLDPEAFPDYQFEFGEVNAKTTIAINDVSVEVEYPITAKKEISKTTISRFKSRYPIRLGYVLNVKNDILSKIKDSIMIDLDYLASLDVKVIILPYDKQNIVYALHDEKSNIGDYSFIFNFAVKTEGNSAPKLEFIPDFVVEKEKQFTYNAKAIDPDNDELFFYSDNSLININSDGVISFFPESVGKYDANICVRDNYLTEDCINVKFMVEDE